MTKTLFASAAWRLPRALHRWLVTRQAEQRFRSEARLSSRLAGAGLDPDYVQVAEADTFHRLELTCASCDQLARCSDDLEKQESSDRLAGYCPNTPTIDELVVARACWPAPTISTLKKNTSEMEVAMKVKDAMHKDAVWVEATTPVPAIAGKMREHDIGAIPVGEKDRLIGMVTDRDLAIRALTNGKDASQMTARDVMSKGIIFCRDTEDVEDAVRIMEQKQIRRLPVLDENKRMVGMLSLGDIAHCASRQISAEALTALSAHHA